MTNSQSADFDLLLADIEQEAAAEGNGAVQDLRAFRLKYRLINKLIDRRRELRWSQKDLARHSGIAQSEISRTERGRMSPTLDTCSRLVTAMELDDPVVA